MRTRTVLQFDLHLGGFLILFTSFVKRMRDHEPVSGSIAVTRDNRSEILDFNAFVKYAKDGAPEFPIL
jgi:hypothetical protein